MRKIATACLLLLIVTVASADAVDTYLRGEMANQRLPGVAVAVLRDGKPVSVRTLGLANIELNAPVTRDTVFKIGSVSKQFIATGIMLLVRDGKVRLDDPVNTYLDDAPAAWSGITLRHLLTHTSGLVRESPGFDGLKDKSDAEVIRKAYDVPLQSAPGQKWAKAKRESLRDWRDELAGLGELKLARFRKVLNSGMDAYDLEFENGPAEAALALDKDGRVSGLGMDRR